MTARKKKRGTQKGPEQQTRAAIETGQNQNPNQHPDRQQSQTRDAKKREAQSTPETPAKKERPQKQSKTRPAERPKKSRNKEQFDPLHQVAFWGLALLLFFPPYFRGLFFAPEQEKALIFATLVFWLAFLWRWLNRDYKFMRSPLDWFALALPVVYIISSFTAVNKGEAIDEVVKNILYFMTYWSISRLVRNQEDIHKLLHVIYVSAVGVALAGLATATGIIHINDGFLQERIYSTFQYPNALASYLGAVALLGIYLWQRSCDHARSLSTNAIRAGKNSILPKRLVRANLPGYLYACGNFLLLAVLIGTKSRGGLLVFGLVFLVYLAGVGAKNRLYGLMHAGLAGLFALVAAYKFIPLAAADKPGQAWLWVIGCLLAVLAGQTVLHHLSNKPLANWEDNPRKYNQAFAAMVAIIVIAIAIWFPTNTAITSQIDYGNLKTAFQRVNYMGTAWEMIVDRPLLGWGGGGWKEAYQSFMDHNYTTREVHSFYFQVGVETGFPGLLAVGGIWVSFLYLALRLYGARDNVVHRPLIWVLLSAFLLIAGHALIDFDLSLSALTMVLWSFMGITTGLVTGVPAGRQEGKKYTPPNYIPVGAATVVAVLIITLSLILTQSHTYMYRGTALLRAQQAAGVEYVEKATAYNPFNAGFRITLSQVYMSMGQTEKALAEAQKAVELSPYDTVPRDNLAQIAMVTGKPEIADQAVEKAVELAPNRLQSYQNMTRVYAWLGQSALQEGNTHEARTYFEKCLQVSERMESYWNSRSETNLKMWRGPKLEVTRTMQLYLGQASYWMGEFDAAEEHLEQAAEDKNLQGEALLYLALVKEKQGQGGEAQRYLEQAQEAVPGIEKNYETLAGMDTL